MFKLNKILCPTDFSFASAGALKAAVQLANEGTEICVVHVAPPIAAADPHTNRTPTQEEQATRAAATVRSMCAIFEEQIPAYVRCRPILRTGTAAGEILRTAEQERVDLIVLATHGSSADNADLIVAPELGHVAAAVTAGARCPVLIINPANEDSSFAALQPEAAGPKLPATNRSLPGGAAVQGVGAA